MVRFLNFLHIMSSLVPTHLLYKIYRSSLNQHNICRLLDLYLDHKSSICLPANFCKNISLKKKNYLRRRNLFISQSAVLRCPSLLLYVPYSFPVVMYGCESWTIKKAECWRIDAFELWCWRRLLRVPWTARRSNQSILKEISPEYPLEGLMLKLKR